MDFSSNFTSIIVVCIFFFISFPFGIIEETQDAKVCFSLGCLPLFPIYKHGFFVIFASRVSSIIPKGKEIKKNMRTTIIDVKFDEESKSEVRIGLTRKGKPKIAENCRKNIKLLGEKNDVKKYLVHQ